MKQTDIAYLAGLIDGEGYIGIKRITSKANGRVNPGYQERIQVRMIDEQAIKFLAETIGGTYYSEKPHAHKGRPLYCFSASDKVAVRIIRTVLPYLRVKRAVAERVLAFREFRSTAEKVPVIIVMRNRWGVDQEFTRYRHSPAYVSACEARWQECSNMNHGI
jgi:hypothetical protein